MVLAIYCIHLQSLAGFFQSQRQSQWRSIAADKDHGSTGVLLHVDHELLDYIQDVVQSLDVDGLGVNQRYVEGKVTKIFATQFLIKVSFNLDPQIVQIDTLDDWRFQKQAYLLDRFLDASANSFQFRIGTAFLF